VAVCVSGSSRWGGGEVKEQSRKGQFSLEGLLLKGEALGREEVRGIVAVRKVRPQLEVAQRLVGDVALFLVGVVVQKRKVYLLHLPSTPHGVRLPVGELLGLLERGQRV